MRGEGGECDNELDNCLKTAAPQELQEPLKASWNGQCGEMEEIMS